MRKKLKKNKSEEHEEDVIEEKRLTFKEKAFAFASKHKWAIPIVVIGLGTAVTYFSGKGKDENQQVGGVLASEGSRLQENENEMLHRKWSDQLAYINEAIYEDSKELDDAKHELKWAEYRLENATDGTRFSKENIPQYQEQRDHWDLAVKDLESRLERYSAHLKEHYEKEPPKE